MGLSDLSHLPISLGKVTVGKTTCKFIGNFEFLVCTFLDLHSIGGTLCPVAPKALEVPAATNCNGEYCRKAEAGII